MSKRDKLLVIFSISVSVFVAVMAFAFPFDVEQYAALGYLGVAVANLLNSATILSPIPAFVVTFVAAQSYNPYILILLSAAMVTIGESVVYFFGDGVDSVVRDYRWHGWLKKWFNKSPFLFLVIWIGLPNPVQSFGQIFAGTVHYPFWKYVLATLLGNLIWFTIVVTSGEWLFRVGLL